MEIRGVARVDAKTKDLVKRLRPGEIAVIDHGDLDEVAAESLSEAKVKAVVNAAPCISGRYPNQGPRYLLERGIPIIDQVGPAIMTIEEGETLTIQDGEVFVAGEPIAVGRLLTADDVDSLMVKARQNLAVEVSHFVDNTLDYAGKEKGFFTADIPLPKFRTGMAGKHVLIVVRGLSYKDDLRAIDSYIRDKHPVLVGVDGGADALLEFGQTPDMIVGDMDSVSVRALQCGAELVVHGYLDGRAPGVAALDAAGVQGSVVAAPGTSEDLALLIAYQLGAELIVAVGTHSNIVDFLEKGRSGMSSTFLTRLKVGSILVDAKGVSKLYQGKPRNWYPLQVAAAALVPIIVVGMVSGQLRQWIRIIVLGFRAFLGS